MQPASIRNVVGGKILDRLRPDAPMGLGPSAIERGGYDGGRA
jgi:hypothetical protein